MKVYFDSSVLVASLLSDQTGHAESIRLLQKRNGVTFQHGLLETFATLTGGRLGFRVDPDVATELITRTVLPRVEIVAFNTPEVISALQTARAHGARGGAVYDYIHLVAARKSQATKIYTFNLSDFKALQRSRSSTPLIEAKFIFYRASPFHTARLPCP